MSSLREQAEELETPYDTMVRFVDSVSVLDMRYRFSFPLLIWFCSPGPTSSAPQAWRRPWYFQVPGEEQDAIIL